MASNPGTVEYIVAQLSAAGAVRAKKMFGEYGLYCDEKIVALICDDQLFVKQTAAGAAFLGDCPLGQPYPGAKPCFLVSGERWDDHAWLSQLVRLTAAELPMPKKRQTRNADARS